jgi:large subunit ribosomal protein L4
MAEKKETKPKAKAKAAAEPKVKKAAPAKAKAEPKPRAKKKAADAEAPAAAATKAAAPKGSLEIRNADAQAVGQVDLHPAVFGVRVNDHLLYEAVKQYRAGGRAGTHMTKNRALVSGSGRKPWRQKGTGRARVGETRTPLWRHGGTVFGPVPRDYSYTMPKKAKAAALRSALSQRVGEGALHVVSTFSVTAESQERPRYTRQLKAMLERLGVIGKTLLVDHQPADALVLSGRNLEGVTVLDDSHVTVYHILDCKNVLVSQEALKKLEERLAP